MEFHGVKIDFIGLAAVIAAIATLVSKLKSNTKKKEENRAETDTIDPVKD